MYATLEQSVKNGLGQVPVMHDVAPRGQRFVRDPRLGDLRDRISLTSSPHREGFTCHTG